MTEISIRTRRRQQPDETRTLILDTAERLLRERPFRELSVDEVMRTTGYGRTVFYRHFTGLPDLVVAVIGRVMPAFVVANQAFIEAAGGELSLEDFRGLLRPIVAHWRAHGTLTKALRDAAVFDEEIDERLTAAQERMRSFTIAALERRREAGFLRDADLRQLALVLGSMTQRYLLVIYGEPEATVPEELAVDTLALVWTSAMGAA